MQNPEIIGYTGILAVLLLMWLGYIVISAIKRFFRPRVKARKSSRQVAQRQRVKYVYLNHPPRQPAQPRKGGWL